MADHNLKRLLDQGLRITVNSDDPAYFGGYVNENFEAVRSALDIDRDGIAQLARNSFEASFLPRETIHEYLLQVDRFVNGSCPPSARTSNVVFASPHSGRDYPKSFLRQSRLDGLAIRSSEDAFVDLLFGDAPAFGAPLLVAVAPRAFIDFNRSADELDAALFPDKEFWRVESEVGSDRGGGRRPDLASNAGLYGGNVQRLVRCLQHAENRISNVARLALT